jgi:hypothetical protein
MLIKKMIGLALSLFVFSGTANAVEVGVGLKAGTLGAGIELSVALTKTINLRAALTSVSIDAEEETITVGDDGAELDVDAELDADYGANAILVDWYVFDGTFHLTAGLLKNNGKLDITGTLIGSGTIDGQAINSSDIDGDIEGEISLGDSYQPYLGVGWGRKAGYDPGFSFTAEIGVALLDPNVDFKANLSQTSTNFADDGELQDTLDDAASDAEDEFDGFDLFPVLSLGINYAF